MAVLADLVVVIARRPPAPRPEEGGSLVEEGEVVRCPSDLGQGGTPGPGQRVHLPPRKRPLPGRLDQRRGAVEIVQQLLGQQDRPHSVEGALNDGIVAELPGHLLRREAGPGPA